MFDDLSRAIKQLEDVLYLRDTSMSASMAGLLVVRAYKDAAANAWWNAQMLEARDA